MKTDKLCAARREFASSASSRRSRLSIIDTLFVDFCPWHSMIFVGGSLYGTFFFFFYLFIQDWREDVCYILFFLRGIEKGLSFLVGAFSKLEIIRYFCIFVFSFRRFVFKVYSFGYFNEIDHRRIDITFVSVFEYLLIFSLFLPFLFSFLFFIRFYCDLLMLFMSTVVFNWICKICLFFVTEARHIDKLLHQFHKCKGNKFEK